MSSYFSARCKDNVKYLSEYERYGFARMRDAEITFFFTINILTESIYGFADVVGQYYLPHNVIRMDGQLSLQLWNVGISDNH